MNSSSRKGRQYYCCTWFSPCSVPDREHAFNTWRKPPGEKGHLWLQEDLPEYTPKARIFLYEYSSKIAYEGTKGLFFDKANDLLEDLYLERTAVGKFLGTSTAWVSKLTLQCPNRPILFLAHSLGGLLVEPVSSIVQYLDWPFSC